MENFFLTLKKLVIKDEHFATCRRKAGWIIGYVNRDGIIRYQMFDDADSAMVWLSNVLNGQIVNQIKKIEIICATDVLFD